MTDRGEYSDPTAPWSPDDDGATPVPPPYQPPPSPYVPPPSQPEPHQPEPRQPEPHQPEWAQPAVGDNHYQPPPEAEPAPEWSSGDRGFSDRSRSSGQPPAGSPSLDEPAPPATAPSWRPRRKRRGAGCLIAAITPFLAAGIIAAVVFALLHHEIKQLPDLPSGHCPSGDVIDCTAGDPYPTIGPSEFAADPQKPVFDGDVELRRQAHDLSADCASAATGALVAALDQHGCTQVARSTYLDPTGTIVASALIFNLPDKHDAETVAAVADHDAPVRPIAAPSGPARGLPDRSQPELYYKGMATGHFAIVLLVQRVPGVATATPSGSSTPTTPPPPASPSSGTPSTTTDDAAPADIETVMKSIGDAMADPIVARLWGGHG